MEYICHKYEKWKKMVCFIAIRKIIYENTFIALRAENNDIVGGRDLKGWKLQLDSRRASQKLKPKQVIKLHYVSNFTYVNEKANIDSIIPDSVIENIRPHSNRHCSSKRDPLGSSSYLDINI